MSILSASTCAAVTEQGEHMFKISDYSLHRGMGVGDYIQSASFDVGGHRWCMLFYPDRFTAKDPNDDMTVVLELVGTITAGATVRVFFTISLFDWTAQRFSPRAPATANFSHSMYLAEYPINRSKAEASGYVDGNRLTIKCALTIVKEPCVLEEHSDVEVPPSDITEHLSKLLESKEGADVTFEVEGEEFPAHKLVLAMWSPVFKAELCTSPRREKDSDCW